MLLGIKPFALLNFCNFSNKYVATITAAMINTIVLVTKLDFDTNYIIDQIVESTIFQSRVRPVRVDNMWLGRKPSSFERL